MDITHAPPILLRRAILPAMLCVAVYAAACLWWRELITVWNDDPSYSHGWLVPLASVYFAYRAFSRIGPPYRAEVAGSDVVAGCLEMVLGFALVTVGWFCGVLVVSVVALVCVLRGLLLVMGGREINRQYGFAALFLVFMAPLPMVVHQQLAVTLQDWVGAASAHVFRWTGVPVYREGFFVHLPGYTMQVGAACSGLRQIVAFLALGAATAHLAGVRRWCKATLLAVSVPVAIAANCLRVVLTGWILMLAGPTWADGVYHTLEGMLTVAVGAAMMAAIAWLLIKLDRRPAAAWPGVPHHSDISVSPGSPKTAGA